MTWEIDHDGDSSIVFNYHVDPKVKHLQDFEQEFISPVLSLANKIEVKMGEIISYYYCKDTEKAIDMQSEILPNTSYLSKVAVLRKVLKKHHSILVHTIKIWTQHWIDNKNNVTGDEIVDRLVRKLRSIRETRNKITHRMIDIDYTHYKKDNYIKLIYCKDDPSPIKYSNKDLLDMEQKQFEIYLYLEMILNKLLAADEL